MSYLNDLFKNVFWYIIREMSPPSLACVPDCFKTQEMCIKAVGTGSWQLCHVPDPFKAQGICDKAVKKCPFHWEYVSDLFVTQQQVKIWHDDSEYHDKDRLIEWYDDCKKSRALKMQNAWHPSRWRNCCMSEDKKKETEKL